MLMFDTIKKHAKSYILVAIVVLSTLIGVAAPFPQDAHAETADQIASNVKLYLNFHAFLSCATTSDQQLGPDAIKRWEMFHPQQVHVGHIISSTDGQVNCQDSNWVSGVASNFGYNDPFDLLCAAKWTNSGGGSCPGDGHLQSGNIGGDALEANMKAALLKNHSEPLLNNAERYYLYSQTFIIGCKATSVVKVSDASSSQKIDANSDNGYTLDQIENYTPTPYYYHAELGHDREISTDATGGGTDQYENPTCVDLTNKANQYAQDYANAIRPGVGEPGTCLDKYANATTAEQTACDNGYKHKGDPNYCSVTYKDASSRNDPNNPEYNACIYGATVATGGMDASSPPQAPTADTKDVTTCSIPGLGWIVCPIVTFMAHITDEAYKLVSNLLLVEPLTTTDASGSMYNTWSVMRNFANVAFVIAFLIIIFSQVTSIGINNYGIKKMLPKLIVGAILVNLSYWICSIGVDLSNIIGGSINSVLQNAMGDIKVFDVNDVGATEDGWVGLAGKILVVGAAGITALYVGLSALIPALIAVLVAIVTVFLVLTFRQALIVLLVVVSPLAFVAYLLPNTESLFKKWRELFQTLLLMYPIIGLLFGASALASKIVMASTTNTAVKVMGAAISVIPLVATPILMKTTTGVLGKFGAYVNNPNRGPIDRMRKGAEGYRKNRQQLRDARALNGGFQSGRGMFVRSKARRNAVLAQRERNVNNARSGYIAQQSLSTDQSLAQRTLAKATNGALGGNTKGDQLLDKMAAGGGPGARSASLAQALTIQQKLEAEEVTAASATIKALNLTESEKRELAGGGQVTKDGRTLDSSSDMALRRAGMQSVIDSGDVKGINDLVDASRGWKDEEGGGKLRQSLADSLGSSSNNPAYLSQKKLEDIRQGTNKDSANQIIEQAITNNTYSPEKIATTNNSELNVVANVATSSTALPIADKQKLVDNAHTALTDPELSRKLGKTRGNVVHLEQNTAPTPLT